MTLRAPSDSDSDSASARPLAARGGAIALLCMLVAAGACDCEGPSISNAGPRIEVDPSSVTFEAIPGRQSEFFLKVSNVGNSVLLFDREPTIVGDDADGEIEFGVTGALREGCDGAPRPLDVRKELQSGACGIVGVRFIAKGDGVDAVVLRFETNDPETPVLDVPIKASAETPDIEVCAYDGETEIACNGPGSVLSVDFGTFPPGEKIARKLRVRSKGSRPVKVEGYELTGVGDFTVTPDTFARELAPGQEDVLTAVFDAAAGGPREAILTLSSNDPDEERVLVSLVGYGDDSKLCLCVRAEEGMCRSPNADFGDVAIGGVGRRWLRLSSCGSKPLELKTLALAEGSDVFTAEFPTLPRTMAPSDPPIEVPLTFKPPTADRFTGRITLKTNNEQGFVLLGGRGVESGCKLQAPSATIDFGQVGVGIEGLRDFAVANVGTADCALPAVPTVTAGGDLKFALAGFPASPVVAPGQRVAFKVSYVPQPRTPLPAQDVGELQIPYSDARPGSPQGVMKVALKGSPIASPKCVLVAEPNTSGLFGRTLNFGQVRVNTEKVMPVTFRNTGSAPCTISNASILRGTVLPGMPDDSAAFKIKSRGTPNVAPGASTSIEVAFTPLNDRDYGSLGGGGGAPPIPIPGGGGPSFGPKIIVTTSDTTTFDGASCGGFGGGGTAGCVGWNLAGKGARSDLQVLPPDLRFGLVTLGCRSREQAVTLYNVGGVPIEITEIKVDPVQQPEIFRVVAPPVPFTLQGGAQKQITVRYIPPDTNIHTASIYIKSNATNVSTANPYTTVSLTGQGTSDPHQVDRFDQNSRPKTDVLFIVDNSGSMSEEQSALAGNAQRFVGVAQQLNTDFQIGVVTTDMDEDNESGRFQGTPKIVVPGTSASSQFANTVRRLGTNGSGTEKGLAAMVAALSDPLINDPAQNKGFLRDDAKLAVIVVSDEEDSSAGTLDFYTDFLKNLKGIYNQSLVTLSAIVGDDPGGCSSSNGDAVAGSRYVEVQKRTSGKFRSICGSDWGQIAADLGLDAFGARNGFPLSRLADPPSIRVEVNGTSAAASTWTYDPGPNAVVFNTGSAPAPGATVVIEYNALCL